MTMKAKVSIDLYREVEAFLYTEARLLDDNHFDKWLNCFANDVRYWMPVRERVQERTDVTTMPDVFALFDDDKKSLELRVLRIRTGHAHAEVPLSVTQRQITNVIVKQIDDGYPPNSPFVVYSNFIVYQERRGLHGVTFFGRREDMLRAMSDGFEIASRKIEMAQQILPTTLSIFF
jgi:dibenzofuran dioxygenase beta subunit